MQSSIQITQAILILVGLEAKKGGHVQPTLTLYYIQRHGECENINTGRGQPGRPK